jgi:hypothetical protein
MYCRTTADLCADMLLLLLCCLWPTAPQARAQWGNYTAYNMTDNSTVVAAAPQPVIQYVQAPPQVQYVQAPPRIQYVPAPAPPPEVRYVVAAQPQQVQQQPQAFMATIPTQTVVAAVPTPVPVPVPVPGPPVTQFVPVSASPLTADLTAAC